LWGSLLLPALRADFRAEIEQQLSAIAELKAYELRQYRMERLGDDVCVASLEIKKLETRQR
jgi:hypothetical protein